MPEGVGPLHVPGERTRRELWLDPYFGQDQTGRATSVTLWLAGLIAALVTTAPPEVPSCPRRTEDLEETALTRILHTARGLSCEQYANNNVVLVPVLFRNVPCCGTDQLLCFIRIKTRER